MSLHKRQKCGNGNNELVCNNRPLASLITWGKQRGVVLNSLIEWERGDDDSNPTIGFGARVRLGETIVSGSELISIPSSLLITIDNALECPITGNILKLLDCGTHDRRCIIYIYLLSERRLGIKSKWFPYINVLPVLPTRNQEVNTATAPPLLCLLWWYEHLKDWMPETPVLIQAKDVLASLKVCYDEILSNQLISKYPELFPLEYFSWDLFRWSHSIFWSRAITIPSDEPALIPIIDSLNHRMGTLMNCHISSINNTSYVCLDTVNRIIGGEEVCINYGAKGNSELLLYYGFFFPNNPANIVPIDVSFAPIDSRGKEILVQHIRKKLKYPSRVFLAAECFPASLFDYARLMTFNLEIIDRADEKINNNNNNNDDDDDDDDDDDESVVERLYGSDISNAIKAVRQPWLYEEYASIEDYDMLSEGIGNLLFHPVIKTCISFESEGHALKYLLELLSERLNCFRACDLTDEVLTSQKSSFANIEIMSNYQRFYLLSMVNLYMSSSRHILSNAISTVTHLIKKLNERNKLC